MNLGWLGVFLEILTRADFANIDSVKERELLEELALLSNTTVSRSRIRPKPQPASESEPSFSLSHTHMHKSLSFAKIFCVSAGVTYSGHSKFFRALQRKEI